MNHRNATRAFIPPSISTISAEENRRKAYQEISCYAKTATRQHSLHGRHREHATLCETLQGFLKQEKEI